MAILDQWGNAAQMQAARSANRYSRERPWEPVELKDIGKLVPYNDRQTLLSASRRLFLNLGPARGAIEQKAMYAVGRAWTPKFTGTDTEFGNVASDWLKNQWYAIGDVRGGMHDFRTALYLISTAIDRDGEAFVLLTQTPDGYPRYQHIPSHRIGSPKDLNSYQSSIQFHGGTLIDGIVYYPSGAPKEYIVLNDEGTASEYLDAANVIHLYDPSWQEQGRGLPAFTHALNDLRDMLQSHDWERLAQMMLSSIGLIEYNEHGGPDFDDPGNILVGDTNTGQGVTYETMEGGAIRYFKSNSGGKLETIKSDRPGDVWESFHDRIIRSALAGINWPYSLVWKPTGQGTAERSEIGKAQRAVEDRQDILSYAATRMVGYAVAKAQKQNILPESQDWWKWEFTYPAKLTIDDGRVSKELEAMWKIGARNMRDIVGMMGKSLEEHLTERAEEVALRKITAQLASEKYGVVIEDREMAMLTSNEPSEAVSATSKTDGTDTTNEDNMDLIKFDNLKAKFDAYGVAVRAGAITPSDTDEELFRQEAGLPPMTTAVKGAWKEDKGFRRPITLVQKIAQATGLTAPKSEYIEE